MTTAASNTPGRPPASAFWRLLQTEARLAWRVPLGMVWGLVFPILLLIVFAAVPAFRRPDPELDGATLLTLYVPVLIGFVLSMLAFVGLSAPLAGYRELPVWTSDPKHTAYRDCVKNMQYNGFPGPIGPGSAAVMAEYVVVDMYANYCARGMSADKAIERAEKAIARAYK